MSAHSPEEEMYSNHKQQQQRHLLIPPGRVGESVFNCSFEFCARRKEDMFELCVCVCVCVCLRGVCMCVSGHVCVHSVRGVCGVGMRV
jgi:hypothetical protein